ncbi:erythromycin esterase [Micromonospora luteifusca]|uniref:Erythromycin esterase n=1 Tax=Micromonospora luteifusca TaxID=709860 RepID=A0ABS2M454_9ACTN|nr:erythromycin esterase family protein [Micromonospora luteifusca]MBM7494959.1 erythromycin esterase [Micromonospora luteifusca]
MNQYTPRRRRLLGAAAATIATGLIGVRTGPALAAASEDPVAMLRRHVDPLGDLSNLARVVGDARVVGLGEASHSAHEFFTLKQNVFQRLVAAKGFTTFVLEASWHTGLRLNDYVVNGVGDPAQIMRAEFQGQYIFWNTQEYLDLITWMRRYNTSRRGQHVLRFVGNDLGYPGPRPFQEVTGYLRHQRPELVARIEALYSSLKPAADLQAGPWMRDQLTKTQEARQADADHATAALNLVRDHGRPTRAGHRDSRAHAWAVQNAVAIAQSFTAYAFPDTQFSERMRFRDRAMADNTAWWLNHHDGKILLASNNGHVAYTSDDPAEFPQPVGSFLREKLGRDYINIGVTFGRGTVNALPDFFTEQPQTYTVTPPPPGHNEHILEQVHRRDYVLDMRTVRSAAHEWLDIARPTRSYGLYWSTDNPLTALARSYDILIHLHDVRAGHLR